MDEARTSDACKMSDLVSGFVDRLSPVHSQYDSLAQAWENLLPGNLRDHCRIGGLGNGCLKILADGSSYMFELQLCKAVLLRELQRLCPSAKVRKIDVSMLR
ncbi:MAG: DciA family protein [Solirubrobacterales bacterium]